MTKHLAIMDDIYDDLKKMKPDDDRSFSFVLRQLITNNKELVDENNKLEEKNRKLLEEIDELEEKNKKLRLDM